MHEVAHNNSPRHENHDSLAACGPVSLVPSHVKKPPEMYSVPIEYQACIHRPMANNSFYVHFFTLSKGSTSLNTILMLSFLVYFLLLNTASSQQICYTRALNTIVNERTGWFVCGDTAISAGGAETCCLPGSRCGSDSLCHKPASENPGNNSWYIARCTDGTYQDPVCRLSCSELSALVASVWYTRSVGRR